MTEFKKPAIITDLSAKYSRILTMKLYYAKGACSLAVRILINELALKCEFISVDIKSKDKKTEQGRELISINPKNVVPVIETDDGHILTEVAVILQYLANTNKAYHLFPEEKHYRHYQVLEWLNYVATDMHKGVGILFNPNLAQEVKTQFYLPLLKGRLAFINQHLSNHTFLSGDEFTLPDIYLLVTLNWCVFLKMDFQNEKHVAKYYRNLLARPAVKKSMQEENLLELVAS
jgi:glutathione S-transferase